APGTPGTVHRTKRLLISANDATPSRPAKLPPLAIPSAARMKPAHAARASAEPTLMRRTPSAARSATVTPVFRLTRMFTALGRSASTIVLISAGDRDARDDS